MARASERERVVYACPMRVSRPDEATTAINVERTGASESREAM
jgi:hypothetical protein